MERQFKFSAQALMVGNGNSGVQRDSWHGSVNADDEAAARVQVERLIQVEAWKQGKAVIGTPLVHLF